MINVPLADIGSHFRFKVGHVGDKPHAMQNALLCTITGQYSSILKANWAGRRAFSLDNFYHLQ